MGALALRQRLEWSYHPAAQQPLKALFAVCVVALFLLLVWEQFPSPLLVCACFLVLLVALGRFFLPNRYVADEEAIRAFWFVGARRLRWRDVKRANFLEDGVFLSPNQRSGIRDSFTGLFVHYGEHKKEVEALIREKTGVAEDG